MGAGLYRVVPGYTVVYTRVHWGYTGGTLGAGAALAHNEGVAPASCSLLDIARCSLPF